MIPIKAGHFSRPRGFTAMIPQLYSTLLNTSQLYSTFLNFSQTFSNFLNFSQLISTLNLTQLFQVLKTF